MRWLLLEKIIEVERGRRARSLSQIPKVPVSAEVLMIEMMAQTGALLLGAERDFSEDVIFAKIQHAEFPSGTKAGDPLEIEVRPDQLRSEAAWFDGTIQSNGCEVARSRFMLMNVGRLVPSETGSLTFHEQFMNHFCVREKVRP